MVIAGIPAYNEEEYIADVVRKTLTHVDEVVVIDDGSTDNTAKVAEMAGATVVKNGTNQGVGRATQRCFEIAKQRNADVLITIDGDGQNNPGEIPRLLTAIFEGGADFVIGSRFLDEQVKFPRYRKLGINIITFLYNFASKAKLTDSQSCYRAYSKRAISLLNIAEKGFPFSVELLVKARQKGLVITEVPISCIYHSNSHSLNPVVHGIQVALAVVRLRLSLKL